MPDVEFTPLPPEEAIEYFRSKGFRFSWRWHEMWQEDHVKAFTVAKAMRLDILQDIRGALDRALSEGTTFEAFKKELTPVLQKKGWWGKQAVDGKEVQLGSPMRLRTIFNVNIQTAYSVGHYRAMTDPDVLKARPWWRYVAVNDSRTRPEHRSWHNTVLPADHPWWNTHFPPCGWGCRCLAVSLSEREMERDGYKVTEHPDERMASHMDPRTGKPGLFPAGIDPGWDYNPGREYLNWDRRTDAGQAALMALRPGQKTWKDFGRPDLRAVPDELRVPAPARLPIAGSLQEAEEVVARAVGIPEGRTFATVETLDGDLAVVHRARLSHLVEKREESRERYANFIAPTLKRPYEIWLSDYEDGLRKTYIGLFSGERNLLTVLRLERDGSLLWNIMQATDKRMNAHRTGTLLYGRDK